MKNFQIEDSDSDFYAEDSHSDAEDLLLDSVAKDSVLVLDS